MSDILEIEHELFDAKILLQGAQIVHFQLKNKQKLFWHTDFSFYKEGEPFRGGSPSVGHGLVKKNHLPMVLLVLVNGN